MHHSFTVVSHRHADELTLHLAGEMDIGSRSPVDEALVLKPDCTGLRVDLSQVSFMDSCGLNVLLRLRLRLERSRIPLAVQGLSGQPRYLFGIVGAHEVFGTGADDDMRIAG